MDYSTQGLPVYHQLPESAQAHVHHISDAIQLSHPPSSPSSPTFNLSQQQRLKYRNMLGKKRIVYDIQIISKQPVTTQPETDQ